MHAYDERNGARVDRSSYTPSSPSCSALLPSTSSAIAERIDATSPPRRTIYDCRPGLPAGVIHFVAAKCANVVRSSATAEASYASRTSGSRERHPRHDIAWTAAFEPDGRTHASHPISLASGPPAPEGTGRVARTCFPMAGYWLTLPPWVQSNPWSPNRRPDPTWRTKLGAALWGRPARWVAGRGHLPADRGRGGSPGRTHPVTKLPTHSGTPCSATDRRLCRAWPGWRCWGPVSLPRRSGRSELRRRGRRRRHGDRRAGRGNRVIGQFWGLDERPHWFGLSRDLAAPFLRAGMLATVQGGTPRGLFRAAA